MSTADLIRSMGAAGASIEVIALAVEALEAKRPRSTSAERMARKRARDADASLVTPRDVTPVTSDVTCDARVLPLPPSPQTPQPPTPTPVEVSTRACEADRLMDVLVASKLAKDRAKGAKASRRCPASWTPSPADCAVGEGEGLTPGEIERALASMRDHEFRTPRSDWSATFRNWLRRQEPARKPERHDRSDAKLEARNANYERSFAGARLAARDRNGLLGSG